MESDLIPVQALPNPTQSEALDQLFAALAKAQGAITNAEKNTTNTFYKSKYADLAACMDAARKPLRAARKPL